MQWINLQSHLSSWIVITSLQLVVDTLFASVNTGGGEINYRHSNDPSTPILIQSASNPLLRYSAILKLRRDDPSFIKGIFMQLNTGESMSLGGLTYFPSTHGVGGVFYALGTNATTLTLNDNVFSFSIPLSSNNRFLGPVTVDLTDPGLLAGNPSEHYKIFTHNGQAKTVMRLGNPSDLRNPWGPAWDKGCLNAADMEFILLRNGVTMGFSAADLNGDGYVNALDYTLGAEETELPTCSP
ncbi:MAG: hypothetical protein ACUVRD_08620 [Bacteroidia bacterium]